MEKRIAPTVKKPTPTLTKASASVPSKTAKKPFTGFTEGKIDSSGTFKYIQIHIRKKGDTSSDGAESKVLIRGSTAFKYHKGILQNWVTKELNASGHASEYEY